MDREMAMYKVEQPPRVPLMEWWKVNSIKYSLLSVVARRIMSVKATSAEAERDFSTAGFVASKYRM